MKTVELFKLAFAKNLKFNFNAKRNFLIIFLITIITAGIMLPGGFARADWVSTIAGGLLNSLLAPIIYVIFYILFFIAKAIAWLGAAAISISLNPAIISAVLNNPVIYEGWKIFRDVANLLFILILLLIALGTIFRSDSYNIKKSLYKFILIIFLINFSFMIAGLFIDFGNFLMYGVLKAMCPPSTSTCFQDFFQQFMTQIDAVGNFYQLKSFSTSINMQAAVGMAIATIYTFIYGLILVALAIFLLIRVAALAILLILAPLAFFGYTAPGLAGLKNKWWDNLIQYVMFGPVFALMLYVTGRLSQNMLDPAIVGPALITADPNLGVLGTTFSQIIVTSIPLIFLVGIIPVTRAFGIAGSGAILGMTTGVAAFAGGYLGSATDRWLARGAADTRKGVRGTLRRGAAYFSPGAWKRAYKAQKAEQEHDYDVATGKRKGSLDKMSDPYGTLKDKWQKKEPEVDPGQRIQERDAHRRWEDKNIKDPHEMINELGASLKQNDHYLAKEIAIAIAAEGSTDDLLDKEMGNHTAEDFAKYFKNNFGDALGEKQLSKMTSRIADIENKNGNNAYKGIGYYDPAANGGRGAWAYNDLDEPAGVTAKHDRQKEEVLKAWDSKDEFNRIRSLKKASLFKKSAVAGAADELTDAGAEMLKSIKGEGLNQIKKMAPKIAKAINERFDIDYPGGPAGPAAVMGMDPHLKDVWQKIKDDFQL